MYKVYFTYNKYNIRLMYKIVFLFKQKDFLIYNIGAVKTLLINPVTKPLIVEKFFKRTILKSDKFKINLRVCNKNLLFCCCCYVC